MMKRRKIKLPVLDIHPGADAAASFGEEKEGSPVHRDNTIDDIGQYESSFDPIQLDYID